MTKKRLWQTIRLCLMMGSVDRVDYLRRKGIFGEIGENVTIMDRKVPLYAKLIRIHNNVRIGSNVTFATHDGTHLMLNKMPGIGGPYAETIGCIEIMDNVFIGTNVTILQDVRIGPNAVVGAGAVVTKDVPANTVVCGVPAKIICSFEGYLSKRKEIYPEGMGPNKQEVSDALTGFMWKDFEFRRKGNE